MPENQRSLDETLGDVLSRREERNKLRKLTINPPGCVDFSSNGYLSLSTNRVIQEALVSRLKAALRTSSSSTHSSNSTCSTSHMPKGNAPCTHQGAALIGSGGSRLLDGNSVFAEMLERKMAAFHGAEAGLLFNSAFDANTGLLGCVPQPDDVILYDEAIHASVHDGMRLSRAVEKIPISHESIVRLDEGEPLTDKTPSSIEGLGQVLSNLILTNSKVRQGRANVFICVEGLYSMDGDVASLRHVADTADHLLPLGNGYVIVDEAHSVGVFGEQGRGLVCELGLESRMWARVIGLGKAMGCSGGLILCSQTTRSYLINYARSFIYTTAMSFPSLTSIDVVYDFLSSGKADSHRKHLKELIRATHRGFQDLYMRRRPCHHILRLGMKRHDPSSTSDENLLSPIIPLFTAHPRSLAQHCQKAGFIVRPIVAPTVPAGSERVRVCLHTDNTMEQVGTLCKVIETWVQLYSAGMIKSSL